MSVEEPKSPIAALSSTLVFSEATNVSSESPSGKKPVDGAKTENAIDAVVPVAPTAGMVAAAVPEVIASRSTGLFSPAPRKPLPRRAEREDLKERVKPDRPAILNAKKLWDEPPPPKKRDLPKMALFAFAFGALLISLPGIVRHHAHAAEEETASKLPEGALVNETALKNWVEAAADEFRPKKRGSSFESVAPPAVATEAPPLEAPSPDGGASLALRRRGREDDPEDLISHRKKTANDGEPAVSSCETSEHGCRRPSLYFEPKPTSGSGSGSDGELTPAGTLVSAILGTPVELRGGGSVTVIAEADLNGAIPKRSRFVGMASLDSDGRIALRFRRLLLPDGREAKIDAEAQDLDGSFGIRCESNANEGAEEDPSVAHEVARDTAGDAASEALGAATGGVGGQIARRAFFRASSRRYQRREERRVSLEKGTKFVVFLHEAVVVQGR